MIQQRRNQNPDTGVSYFQGGNVGLNGNTTVATLTVEALVILLVLYDANSQGLV